MLGEPKLDRRSRRREATRQEILEAAWRLADREGLAGFSLRDLASEVGMRAPSLYEYYSGKPAIYDAMFEQAYRDFGAEMADIVLDTSDPVGTLAAAAGRFIGFCAEQPARYQLMFQRVVPGFEPSPGAYAASLEVMADTRGKLAALGIVSSEAVDLWLALVSGMAAQQLANDPGGDRWLRLVEEAAEMFLTHHDTRSGT